MDHLLVSVINLAKLAGEKILAFYQQDLGFELKQDASPITAADMAAHKAIVNGLKKIMLDVPILSEESADIAFEERKNWRRYWLIDPLDGTKEFIQKNDEFTVNIALIENHRPILGVVFAPALNSCYFAMQGKGAFKQAQNNLLQPISVHSVIDHPVRIVASRNHGSDKLQQFLQQVGNYTISNRGSALKFGLIAEGTADIYPRLGPTSEWDTAAAQCIVEAAGGAVLDLKGNPLRYNTKASLLNPEFIAIGDTHYNWQKYFNNERNHYD